MIIHGQIWYNEFIIRIQYIKVLGYEYREDCIPKLYIMMMTFCNFI